MLKVFVFDCIIFLCLQTIITTVMIKKRSHKLNAKLMP